MNSSVFITSTPRSLPVACPETRAPPMIGICIPVGLNPIRRLKNGTRLDDVPLKLRLPAPNANVPEFSRKKSRFSGKNRLKRVRFTCC